MADHAALTKRVVLINKRTGLRSVALKARFVFAQERKAAALKRLLNIGPAAFDRDPDVWVMAIRATHFAFQHGMMMRQLELCPYLQVTLETSFRRFTRIYNRASAAAGFNVQTARAVARLTAHVLCVLSFGLQSRVRRGAKVAHDLFVAGFAFLRANELRARDAGWG
jgi:hypothetical protein